MWGLTTEPNPPFQQNTGSLDTVFSEMGRAWRSTTCTGLQRWILAIKQLMIRAHNPCSDKPVRLSIFLSLLNFHLVVEAKPQFVWWNPSLSQEYSPSWSLCRKIDQRPLWRNVSRTKGAWIRSMRKPGGKPRPSDLEIGRPTIHGGMMSDGKTI